LGELTRVAAPLLRPAAAPRRRHRASCGRFPA